MPVGPAKSVTGLPRRVKFFPCGKQDLRRAWGEAGTGLRNPKAPTELKPFQPNKILASTVAILSYQC